MYNLEVILEVLLSAKVKYDIATYCRYFPQVRHLQGALIHILDIQSNLRYNLLH